MAGSSTGGGGARKIGRGMKSPSHNRYNSMGQREVNKVRKLKSHLKRCENDKVALKALKNLGGIKY